MPRFIGHTADLDPQVNASYFVTIAGRAAQTYYDFTRRTSRSPPEDIEPIPVFQADHRDYRTAQLGYLIQASLRLECVRNSRGAYRCSNTGHLYNKITYLKPKIYNPMLLERYLPSGTMEASPVYINPRPDRNIRIPINMIEITCLSEPMIPRPLHSNQDFFRPPPSDLSYDHQGSPNRTQPLPFTIYLDPASQNETPAPGASTVYSGNLNMVLSDAAQVSDLNDVFEPEVTSTKTPERSQAGPSSTRTRRTSSVTLAQEEAEIVDLTRLAKKTPTKKSRKSPGKLIKTPSQPVITDFTTSGKKRRHESMCETQPIPAKRVKRILSDLTDIEYAKARSLMDAVERDDPCIKEATLDLDLDLENIQIQQHSPQLFDDIPNPQEAPTLPLEQDLGERLALIMPFNPYLQISAHRTLPLVNPPNPQPAAMRPEDDIIAFNITNTVVAQANLDNAARPRRGPETPEHTLIVIEDFDTITHVLNFQERHNPMDVVEAFFNRSLNTTPDEGIDASSILTPSGPPPTPSSSTEAVAGSSTAPKLNSSPNASSDLNAADNEDAEEDKGEKEKGEERKGHANM